MVSRLLSIFGILCALLLAWIAARPDDASVERDIAIGAKPAVVYDLLRDFHAWERWSPWTTLDASMKATYGGPVGIGATFTWDGNEAVGAGKMTLVDLQPDREVSASLEFLRPVHTLGRMDFTITPESHYTRVRWRFTEHHDFTGKAFGLLMNVDQLVGRDLDLGLVKLKAAAEEAAAMERTAPAEPPATDDGGQQ